MRKSFTIVLQILPKWRALLKACTWPVRKVSRILNFRELRICEFGFFCGVMLILISPTYADKFDRFEFSVNFWQLFCLDVFWLVFDFCLFGFGNEKVMGARSGEYGGCGNIIVLILAKNSRTSNGVWAGALLRYKSQFLFFRKSGRFWRIVSHKLRITCR